MNITAPQPSGNICKDCHETIRRGGPGVPRAQTVAKLDNTEFRNGEFAEARATYQQDTQEKIQFGSSKVKKRAKAVKKKDTTKVKQRLKGKMMRVSQYREAGSGFSSQRFAKPAAD